MTTTLYCLDCKELFSPLDMKEDAEGYWRCLPCDRKRPKPKAQ